jgi:CO/xanthine dehydrogenase FAD-binding subunit
MRIRPFEYHTGNTLEDALVFMGQHGPETKIVAGGTDLVLLMKKKQAMPQRVFSLLNLKELDFVRAEGRTVRIGSLIRHADLAQHGLLKDDFSILCQASGLIGSWQIRNVGTLGGNLCNASPSADSAPPLLAFDARIVIAEAGTQKEIPLSDFFTGPGTTVLEPHQILKEIVLVRPQNRSAGCYHKLRRRKAVDLSLASVAFQAETDSDGRILAKVAIGMGGVAPTPIRAPEAEAVLIGRTYADALEKIDDCVAAAVAATRPIDDIRASAAYRRSVVASYVRQSAEKVLNTLLN